MGSVPKMTEFEYINELNSRWPRKVETSQETLALADEAVRTFPQSAILWVIRGDLIQLSAEDCPQLWKECFICYKRAIKIDPQFAEAWEEAAHFL